MGFSETICSVSNVQCLVWSGQMFSSSGEWCLSEHLSVVSEGMGFSETICSVSNVQWLVWSGRCFSSWWMVSIRASISCFGGNGLLRNDRSVSNVQCLVWSGQMFFFLVNGVYQSIYQLFRREWASQKRSVVCLMFSAWSDRGRCFSSSQVEWCLSEHLSVVSEGMGFSETICSVSNVQCLVWSGADVFLLLGEWCLSEHLSVVSEGMGFSETICSVSNV